MHKGNHMDQTRRQFIGTVVTSLVALPSLSFALEEEQEMFSYWNGKEEVSVPVQEILDRYKPVAEEFFFQKEIGVLSKNFESFGQFIHNLYDIFQCPRLEYNLVWISEEGGSIPHYPKKAGLDNMEILGVVGRFYSLQPKTIQKIHQEAKDRAASMVKSRILGYGEMKMLNQQHDQNVVKVRQRMGESA